MEDILILGACYAGVTAGRGLNGIGAQVSLGNRHAYHQLTTLLHQPVVGHRNFHDPAVPQGHGAIRRPEVRLGSRPLPIKRLSTTTGTS